MDPMLLHFGVPGYDTTPPNLNSDFEIINETPQHSGKTKLTKNMFCGRASDLSHGDKSDNATQQHQQQSVAGNSSAQEQTFNTRINNPATAPYDLNDNKSVHQNTSPFVGQHPLLGLSPSQLESITQLVNCIKNKPSEATNRSMAEKMVNIAPRFDLRNVSQSLEEFRIFFDVNCITSEEVQFLILQGKLPWSTMVQFGEEFPNCGGNLHMLKKFLKANTPKITPSMKFCDSVGKFGEGTLFRDMYHSAVMASKLDKDELVKLFCYIFTNDSKHELVHEYMDLPFSHFVDKISKKWDKGHRSLSRTYGQQYTPNTYSRGQNLCTYHRTYGDNAIKCMAPLCIKASQPARPNSNRYNQGTKNEQPQV